MFRNLLPSLFIGAAFFGVFVLILPQYDNIKLLWQEIEIRQEILEERKKAIQSVAALERQITNNENLDRLNIIIPKSTKVDEIISSMDTIARQSGLRMSNISANPVTGSRTGNTGFSPVSIEVSLAGNYDSLLNFLSLIEQNLRIYDVKEMTISVDQAGELLTQQQVFNFNVSITAYQLPGQ